MSTTPTVVKARFYVLTTTKAAYVGDGGGMVVLQAVSRGDQNAQWASATPAGKVEMTINNPEAFAIFDGAVGKDVDVTFAVEVPVLTPGDGHPFRKSAAPDNTVYGSPGTCGDCGQKHPDAG